VYRSKTQMHEKIQFVVSSATNHTTVHYTRAVCFNSSEVQLIPNKNFVQCFVADDYSTSPARPAKTI
jgi:hypothetical protein